MAIRSMQETALTPRPMRGDTLIVDGGLYVLIRRAGQFGYMRDGTFVPLTGGQLELSPTRRAGAVTWEIVPEGRERPRPPTPEKKKTEPEHKFLVRLSYQKSQTKEKEFVAKDADTARNKGIAWYATLLNIPYAQAHSYFKSHTQSIEVKPL